jgi:glutamate carboxypeptidase
MTDPISTYLGSDTETVTQTILARIIRYVEHETPSRNEQNINALAELIGRELMEIGGTVTTHPAPGLGTNILARFPANGSNATSAAAPILMLAHIDTVHDIGTLAMRPIRIGNGRMEGPGAYDMKAGLALLVEAIAWHHRNGTHKHRPITLLVTCDEEIGSHSSREMIMEHARNAAVVLVPEPCLPDGGVKTARKGVATYRVTTTGRASHAGGEPGSAVSAITEMVHQCERILLLADHSKGTTVNIGTIRGGTATNVVAERAEIGVDVRIAAEGEEARVDNALRSMTSIHPDTTLLVELTESRPPLLRTAVIEKAFGTARECAKALGVELTEGMSGGGSDGSIAASTGVAVLDGLGPQGGGAHAVDEHIITNDLPFRLALICRLIECL